MHSPDVAGACQYACARLTHELPATLVYHSLAHTRDDVVPAAEQLAQHMGVTGEDLLLLRTAAWFHDLGFVVQRTEHEAVSIQLAAAVLPNFGYSAAQIAQIGDLIQATRLPQTPCCPLAGLLADADLDNLGRPDFLSWSLLLRAELEAHGQPTDAATWYQRQLAFLQNHRYFTLAARQLRAATRQHNILLLEALLAQSACLVANRK
jgi:uncharacterized protein